MIGNENMDEPACQGRLDRTVFTAPPATPDNMADLLDLFQRQADDPAVEVRRNGFAPFVKEAKVHVSYGPKLL